MLWNEKHHQHQAVFYLRDKNCFQCNQHQCCSYKSSGPPRSSSCHTDCWFCVFSLTQQPNPGPAQLLQQPLHQCRTQNSSYLSPHSELYNKSISLANCTVFLIDVLEIIKKLTGTQTLTPSNPQHRSHGLRQGPEYSCSAVMNSL